MYEELIAELREEAEWAKANEWETPIMLSDHLTQAADVIEELSVVVRAQKAVLDKFPKWIPATERLPEEWWPVLGLIKFHEKEEPPAQQVLWYLGNGHWREVWRGDMIENDVTHWMPLPSTEEVLTGTDTRGGIRRDDAGNVIDWGITDPPGDVGKTEDGE